MANQTQLSTVTTVRLDEGTPTTHAELVRSERELRTLMEGVPQLLWRSCDKGLWTWASPQWLDYTGQSQAETHGRGWMAALHPADHAATLAAWEQARPHGVLDVEFRVRRVADGAYIWHRTRSLPVRNERGGIVEWLGSTTDVQPLKDAQNQLAGLLEEAEAHAAALEAEVKERERAQSRLFYMAHHDDLTRLYSRGYFLTRLRQVLGESQKRRARCAVMIVDLDRFKLVNDSLGHHAGDLLLVEVARRLRACIRPEDVLARIGGDEFALLLDLPESMAWAADVALRMINALAKPLWLGEQEVFASCSVGLVQAGTEHMLAADVLRDADIALYEAKRRGQGRFVLFTSDMRQAAVEALRLRTDLRHALGRGELFLEYQPICRTDTREIVGVEALVRWTRPEHGRMPPDRFIGLAEELGLIGDIGRWVLREAALQMRTWQARYPAACLVLSVNASGGELQDPAFLPGVAKILEETGLDPKTLQIELTESMVLRDPASVAQTLQALHAMGVRVALDDFGTGYSALGYLDRFAIDSLKLDRSFVDRMAAPRTMAVVDAVVGLAQALGMAIVAEGIEDEGQLALLRQAGCGLVQGFLLGSPMDAETFAQALGP